MPQNIVFHFPRPLIEGGTSGSLVRPPKMLEAFRDIGYDVAVVAGYQAERSAAAQQIKTDIAAGRTFQFVYSETINGPLLLAERDRLKTERSTWRKRLLLTGRPREDFGLFSFLHAQGIPAGLFCRDVHWRFPHGETDSPLARKKLRQILFRQDWFHYSQTIDHLFLPALEMNNLLPNPWPRNRISELPPGCTPHRFAGTRPSQTDGITRLFYVGGIVPPHYDLRPLFRAVTNSQNVALTVCCRSNEWELVKQLYQPYQGKNVSVVHASGAALANYYGEADIFAMVWEPYEYWQYTISIKVFEALGYGVPIIASSGTVAGNFVLDQAIGWTVKDEGELCRLLRIVSRSPEQVDAVRRRIEAIQGKHTWQARAKTVSECLTEKKKKLNASIN